MRTAIILTLAVVLGLMALPLSSATVMHATINTQTNVGTMDATSNYVLFYTYPANSSSAKELNGTVVWLNATSYLNSTSKQELSDDMGEFEDQGGVQSNDSNASMNDQGNSSGNSTSSQQVVHVVNGTLTYQVHAFANQTSLTVYRNLTLHLTITNITKKTANNTTVIDMSWRAFGVQGQFESMFHGTVKILLPAVGLNINTGIDTSMDVNELGDMNLGLGDQYKGSGNFDMGDFFEHAGFGGDMSGFATINFHVFAHPLSDWVRVYNPATNSTTFYYNTSTSFALNSTVNDNGSIYTVKLKVDPHGSITTNGNAKPTSSNELAITPAPASSISASSLVIIAVVAIVAIAAAVSITVRRSKSGKKA